MGSSCFRGGQHWGDCSKERQGVGRKTFGKERGGRGKGEERKGDGCYEVDWSRVRIRWWERQKMREGNEEGRNKVRNGKKVKKR